MQQMTVTAARSEATLNAVERSSGSRGGCSGRIKAVGGKEVCGGETREAAAVDGGPETISEPKALL